MLGVGTGQVLLDGRGVRQQMCPHSGEAVGSALITLAVQLVLGRQADRVSTG